MAKFTAKDYIEYNTRYDLYGYGYLHRLLDLIYKTCKFYKIKNKNIIFWTSETGNQAELKGTMYLDITTRIILHKRVFQLIWQQRKYKF